MLLKGTDKNDALEGTDKNDTLEGTDKNDTLEGNAGDDFIFGNNGDDLVYGGAGDDLLYGGSRGQAFFTTGGSDTLTGGKGSDLMDVSLENGGGSVIKDRSPNDGDFVFIIAKNTDIDTLATIDYSIPDQALATYNDPNTWGDAVIELSRLEKGIVGLEKSGTSLIIDISRDGVAKASDDLTITNYFDDQGNLGAGAPAFINNITNQQDIVDFFA
jgi:RTX calcium-binding nonapeptide repeat (4 copies)